MRDAKAWMYGQVAIVNLPPLLGATGVVAFDAVPFLLLAVMLPAFVVIFLLERRGLTPPRADFEGKNIAGPLGLMMAAVTGLFVACAVLGLGRPVGAAIFAALEFAAVAMLVWRLALRT